MQPDVVQRLPNEPRHRNRARLVGKHLLQTAEYRLHRVWREGTKSLHEAFLVNRVGDLAFVVGAAALALWLVSLVTTPPPREHVARFAFDPA